MIFELLVFFLLLSILVLIHELGHFLVAKRFNIKVEEFGFGLPPRAWGKKIGETIYSLNWLPIGGFVKLFGEDEAGGGRVQIRSAKLEVRSENKDRAFFSRPVHQRAAVVIAGVVMNTLLAILIYYVFLFISGFKTELPLIGDHKFAFVNQQNTTEIILSDIQDESPAKKAGITPISKVIAINNEPIDTMDEFLTLVKGNAGKEITITWLDLKSGKTQTSRITPRVNPPKNQGALGVGVSAIQTAVLSYDSPVQKTLSGIIHPFNLMVYNFEVLGKLLSMAIAERNVEPLSEVVSGPVGIFSLVGTILQLTDVKEKVLQILNLAGILSISLAVFNILPIPALDGGRFLFILVEWVTGKKLNPKIEGYAHQVGMMLLIGLILLITLKDVLTLF